MASDPERPIEKLLRDYAERRRAQGPLPLHPATRRLLHGEVQRRYGRANGPAGSFGGWRALRTLGWALAGMTCLGIATAVWVNGRKGPSEQALLAQHEPAAARQVPEAITQQLALDQAKPLAENPAQQFVGRPTSTAAPTALPPLVAAAPEPAPGNNPATAGIGGFVKADSAPAPAANGMAELARSAAAPDSSGTVSRNFAAAAASSESLQSVLTSGAAAQAKETLTWTLPPTQSQLFIRVAPPEDRAVLADNAPAPPAAVLTSFQVQQVGTTLRVVDQDGSLYVGQWGDATNNSVALQLETRNRLSEATVPATTAYRRILTGSPAVTPFFRVAGTNLSLGEPVVFSGSFLPLTNNPAGSTGAMPLLDKRITGKVKIGPQQEFEVKAIPAQR